MAEHQTPKGMRDFSGSALLSRQRMLRQVEDIYQSWGYQPLSTPALEHVSTLTAKSGDEIAGQLFKIEESTLAMRFDLTVPLARFAANTTLPKPYKRYCIAPVWRREEPQKGRLREFLQADADIVGCASMRAEAELLAMASEALRALGIAGFTIHLNNRKILSGLVAALAPGAPVGPIFRALDKLDKVGVEGVRAELTSKAGLSPDAASALLDLVHSAGASNEQALHAAAQYSAEGAHELTHILQLLRDEHGLSDARIDLSLVRGLGYYTGPIFEIKAGGGIGSVAGGGRYDDLLGLYGQPDCAVGLSLGIERLWYLKEQALAPGAGGSGRAAPATPTQVMVVAVKPELAPKATALASDLRRMGVRAESDLAGRPMRKQLDHVNALGIPYALVVGEQELKSGQFTLKSMASGEQKSLSLEQVAEAVAESIEAERDAGRPSVSGRSENRGS